MSLCDSRAATTDTHHHTFEIRETASGGGPWVRGNGSLTTINGGEERAGSVSWWREMKAVPFRIRRRRS
jgi:hypothetical protein